MSQVVGVPGADLRAPLTTCEALWAPGVPCPNPIVEVAVCTNAPGFCPMCEVHAASFKREYPGASVRWLTVESFDLERANGLYSPEASA